ncbi:MAG: hypothetical protein DWP92_08715, partial [Armatimonadetes bacterium]
LVEKALLGGAKVAGDELSELIIHPYFDSEHGGTVLIDVERHVGLKTAGCKDQCQKSEDQ